MKLSFATLGCPNWRLEEIAANARSMGYDGVELRGVKGEHIGPGETQEELKRIKGLFADNKVEIACIMGYSRFTMLDRKQREEQISYTIKMLELARDVSCPVLRIFGGNMEGEDRAANIARVVDCLKTVSAKAEKLGVKMALETHDDWCKGENLVAVLKGVGSPALGVCWDVGNSFFSEPLEKTCDSIKGQIYHVHFKDAAREADGKVKSRLPGTGEVDLKSALRLIKETGYKGYLSFEWEKKWEPGLAEPEIAFPHFVAFTKKLMAV